MSELKLLIIHCTDTLEGRIVTPKDIHQWHVVERGWKRVGYSDLIGINGEIQNLIPYNDDDVIDIWERSNGVGKQFHGEWVNGMARHLVYAGGKDKKGNYKDTRTKAQRIAMAAYVKMQVALHPNIKVAGHYQFDNSKPYCPGFDMVEWCKSIGIPERNIFTCNGKCEFKTSKESIAAGALELETCVGCGWVKSREVN